ncbi:hypothetical protein ALC62_00252 [Cyphomyrmex costatus]|uniref:Uncharacterized protein n=1 Tax=Cyphomyrmex costatus TaxID=456900 RepID=A0A195D7E3_9HYME|nr:hypothetical protein ALC62_00252 [Cyphomyrmex costatus]
MERQHFVVLIDPVGRGRKTKHPSTGDESAACRERAREIVGRRGRRTDTFAGSGTSVADTARARGTSAGKRESGIEGTGRESRDPHPADSYNFNHQLATLLPPRGRVICEKHVDLWVEEGRLYSFISSYISFVTAGCSSLGCTPGPLRSQTADRQGSGPSFRVELQSCNVHDHAAKRGQHEEE